MFGTPKTEAGTRRVPLSEATLALLTDWRARVKRTARRASVLDLVGKADFAAQRHAALDCPGLHAARAPEGDVAYVSAHLRILVTRQGCAGQGGREVDGTYERGRTLNVYTQAMDGALRAAVDNVGSELFTIVHNPEKGRGAKSLKRLAPQAGLEPGTLRLTAGCSTIELLRNRQREPLDGGTLSLTDPPSPAQRSARERLNRTVNPEPEPHLTLNP